MFEKMQTWHWIALLVVAYFVYQWYMKNRAAKSVSIPSGDVSATTLTPSSTNPEANGSTDPTIATQVTKVSMA